jgi:small GTP-binding protein
LPEEDADVAVQDAEPETRIIIQEDKQHYLTLAQTFGDDVETIVQDRDNQDINVPLVQPENVKETNKIEDSKIPKTNYSKDYLVSLLNIPSKIRNVSIVGGLNSGKTSLLDLLILETHQLRNLNKHKKPRYTDNTRLEIERGITLKSSTMTLLLENLSNNSIVCNIVDTPGHSNFLDEVAVAQRLTDISVVVVDVVEGLTLGCKKAIDNAILNHLQIVLLINKIDRLILELKLPVLDSFHKIRNVIDEFNTYIQENQLLKDYTYKDVIYSPELNNVLFASTDLHFAFNLRSFAKLYYERHGIFGSDFGPFAQRLWGDIYYDESSNKFSNKGEKRSFIHFILEPLYKLVTQVLTKEVSTLQKTLYDNFGVSLPKKLVKSNTNAQFLLKESSKLIFGNISNSFVDALQDLNTPETHNKNDIFTSTQSASPISDAITTSSATGPLIANVVKIVDSNVALARIFSGTLNKADKVKVLGENYNDDDDDFEVVKIDELYLSCGRYKIPVDSAPAGSLVLIGGIDNISKSGTMFRDNDEFSTLSVFKPIDYLIQPVFKVIIEPIIPSDLPKLLEGLRNINKFFPGTEIKVEESGEHVIFGSGELYLDSLLFELRALTKIDIKVSDPVTKFSETVIDQSFTKISIKSTNEQNSITIIAEPLDDKLSRDVENGKVKPQNRRNLNKVLREEYEWDSLEARSLWSFGPNINGPNALLDDTISDDENDAELLKAVKDSIIQGFQWSCREGPLADEPIRNVKFKIIDFKLSDNVLHRGNGQIIPMVRKACYAAILISTPKLMEPVYSFEIITKSVHSIPLIDKILDRRRGAILRDEPVSGCQLYKVYGFIPVIDSVGFETDVRVLTQGGALISFFYDKWAVVPGDPLDKDLIIPKLKPASINSLARDFVVKTRKRKGLIGEPNLTKYIDQELVESLKELGLLE